MPKKVKGKAKKERRGPQSGDTYKYEVAVEIVDVNGDGIKDLSLTHTCTNLTTGLKCVSATIVWECLDDMTVVAFNESLERAGVVDSTQTLDRFTDVVKEWKKLTKSLEHINKLGEQFATVALGE